MTDLLIDERYVGAVQEILSAAKTDVVACLYKATVRGKPAKKSSRMLLDILDLLARRGRTIRVLLNTSSPSVYLRQQNKVSAEWMKLKGFQVKQLTGARCNHAKFVIVDSTVAVIGSHNWSFDSLRRNHEVSVVVEDPKTVKRLSVHFEKLWPTAVPFE